jgi:hypothetical protein
MRTIVVAVSMATVVMEGISSSSRNKSSRRKLTKEQCLDLLREHDQVTRGQEREQVTTCLFLDCCPCLQYFLDLAMKKLEKRQLGRKRQEQQQQLMALATLITGSQTCSTAKDS